MTTAAAFVDAEGVIKDWFNSLSGIVGSGNVVALGAHLHRLRSPFRGSYVLLSVVGTPIALTEERSTAQARVSASVYGVTKESATAAALAYANALADLGVKHPTVGTVQILTADAITGPVYIPDIDEERYIVDADIYFKSLTG